MLKCSIKYAAVWIIGHISLHTSTTKESLPFFPFHYFHIALQILHKPLDVWRSSHHGWHFISWNVFSAKLNCCASQLVHPFVRVLWSSWTALRSQSLHATLEYPCTISCPFPRMLLIWHAYADFSFTISEWSVYFYTHRPIRFNLLSFRDWTPGSCPSKLNSVTAAD